MKIYSKIRKSLALGLLCLSFSSTAQISDSGRDGKTSFSYLKYLDACKSAQQAGDIALARTQLDSARFFFRRELGLSNPKQFYLNIELAQIQRAEGELELALASLQRALGSLQVNVRSGQLEFNPKPAFNRNDSIIIRLLIKKANYLFELSSYADNPLRQLSLAKQSLSTALSWMQEMVSYGWWCEQEKKALTLLKRLSVYGIKVTERREKLMGEELHQERKYWLYAYFQTKNALLASALKPIPSAQLPDSINNELSQLTSLLLSTRLEYENWTDANGTNNLQTVILKENIAKTYASLQLKLDEASVFAPKLRMEWKPVWRGEAWNVNLSKTCLEKKSGLLNYLSYEDSIYCFYEDQKKHATWTFAKAQMDKHLRDLEEVLGKSKEDQHAGNFEKTAFKLYKLLFGPIAEDGFADKLHIIADYPLLDLPFEALVSHYEKDASFETLAYVGLSKSLHFYRSWDLLCFQEDYSEVKAKRYQLGEQECEQDGVEFSSAKLLNSKELNSLREPDYESSYWLINQFPNFFKADIENQHLDSKLLIWNANNLKKWSSAELHQMVFMAGSPNLLFNTRPSCNAEEQYFWKNYFRALSYGKHKWIAWNEALENQVSKGDQHAHPSYWIGKRYYGDRVPLKKRYKVFAQILLGISLALASFSVLVMILKRRQKFLRNN